MTQEGIERRDGDVQIALKVFAVRVRARLRLRLGLGLGLRLRLRVLVFEILKIDWLIPRLRVELRLRLGLGVGLGSGDVQNCVAEVVEHTARCDHMMQAHTRLLVLRYFIMWTLYMVRGRVRVWARARVG